MPDRGDIVIITDDVYTVNGKSWLNVAWTLQTVEHLLGNIISMSRATCSWKGCFKRCRPNCVLRIAQCSKDLANFETTLSDCFMLNAS